jgi:RNA polymerase sigma-70 factor (family 1)
MTRKSEQELIEDLRNDSEAAFASIYDIYALRLMAFCRQYVKTTEDAEEIVGDVFMQLWNHRKQIEQQQTLKGLLFVMSKRMLINAYRKTLNSPIYEKYITTILSNQSQGASYKVEYDDFLSQVERAMSKLSKTQREIIRHSRFEGLELKEIAAKMSLSEQTVKNQLSVGLKLLKQQLGISVLLPSIHLLVNQMLL